MSGISSLKALGIALVAVFALGACSDSNDPPVATLVSVSPDDTSGSSADATDSTTTPNLGDIKPPPEDYGPPPPEVMTAAQLREIEGTDGYSIRSAFRPLKVVGLCGASADFKKVWSIEAVDAETLRLFGQSVFEMADAEAAKKFIAELQGGEQGCSWKAGEFDFGYVGQETGVQPVGDSHFAYRATFGPSGGEPIGEPVLQVFFQKGPLLISVSAPATTDMKIIDDVLAKAAA